MALGLSLLSRSAALGGDIGNPPLQGPPGCDPPYSGWSSEPDAIVGF